MPTGYAGEGKRFSKKTGRWIKTEKEKAFDYLTQNLDSCAFLINFFRWYPDYFADLLRDEHARFSLELPQRLMLRVCLRERNVYITGVRGLTKTFIIILAKMIEGVLYPGVKIRYVAPNQKQAASLAAQTFHEIEKSYPALSSMWSLRNDRQDMFRMTTIYGSEFTMYTPRGDTCSGLVGEECGQEGESPFPMDFFINSVYPTCRDVRMVNQKEDTVYINNKRTHIGNACERGNRAFSELRRHCLEDMLKGNIHDGYVLDISWITALLGNLRNIDYFKTLKRSLSPEAWLRECCAIYTGAGEQPLIPDETLSKSRRLMLAEHKHSGEANVIYVVAHDVSYVRQKRNAACSDVVLKLSMNGDPEKRDKFLKEVVYVDSYAPPLTAHEQAEKVRDVWERFLKDGQTTYLAIDAQAYGTEIIEELMKPRPDGKRPLCSVDHAFLPEIEAVNAIPCLFAVKAGGVGTKYPDAEMIQYAQTEFAQGNVFLLTSSLYDGLREYKVHHGIKGLDHDAKIAKPYQKTNELCQEIANLKAMPSGQSLKEVRKSKSIQRDMWSALKYALRIASMLEDRYIRSRYRKQSSWKDAKEYFSKLAISSRGIQKGVSERQECLSIRREL